MKRGFFTEGNEGNKGPSRTGIPEFRCLDLSFLRYLLLIILPLSGFAAEELKFGANCNALPLQCGNQPKNTAGEKFVPTFSQSLSRASDVVTLLNDLASPGNSKYYGTNNSGLKGWWDIDFGGGGGTADWGDIGGTITDQADLQAALDAKLGAVLAENFVLIDATNGDDATGLRERIDKPFQTVAAAMAVVVAGDTIKVRAGDYSITSSITLPSNTTLEGSGRLTRIFIANGTNTSMSMVTNSDTTNGNTGIVIRNLRLDGNNTGNTTGAQSGISLQKVTNFIIENNWIEHLGRVGTSSCIGIAPVTCSDGVIKENWIDDTVDGINTSGVSTRLTVVSNVITGTNRDYPLNIASCTHSSWIGNVVKSSANSVGLAAINVIGNSDDNLIANNIVYQSLGSGIKIRGSTACDRNLVIGNVVRGCGTYGIEVTSAAGANNVIMSNDVRGSGATADISIDATPSGTVCLFNDQAGTQVSIPGNFLNGAVNDSAFAFTDVTTSNASTTKHGLMPKGSGVAGQFFNSSNGQSAVTDANLSLSDVTTNDVSTTKHGFTPKLPNDASLFLNGTGGYTAPGGGAIFSQTVSVSVGDTTTETTLVGSGSGSTTLTTDFLTVGKVLKVTARGIATVTGSTPTGTVRVKVGGTTVGTAATQTFATESSKYWELESLITCRATGVSGTVFEQGMFRRYPSAVDATTDFMPMKNTAVATVNTTISNAVDVTWQWSNNGTAGKAFTCTNLVIEAL